jgi:hypothetical protein
MTRSVLVVIPTARKKSGQSALTVIILYSFGVNNKGQAVLTGASPYIASNLPGVATTLPASFWQRVFFSISVLRLFQKNGEK